MYTEYELGISRTHSNARYIGMEACREAQIYELGRHSMSIEYIDFWANDNQLKKVIKNLSRYSNLDYTITIKEVIN